MLSNDLKKKITLRSFSSLEFKTFYAAGPFMFSKWKNVPQFLHCGSLIEINRMHLEMDFPLRYIYRTS